ncbi:MAG TPA: arylsulfatase [Solimonas sp.]
MNKTFRTSPATLIRRCVLALLLASLPTLGSAETAGSEMPTAAATAPRPNIVLVIADDMGFTDVGAYGSEIRTPHLDEMAARGAQFTNFHTAPLCSPTRAMLMTGTDNHIAGIGNLPEVTPIRHQGKPGYLGRLDDRVVTVATLLNDAGYRTYMTGKWHLGKDQKSLPHARGFERSFALEASGADNWEQRSYLPIYDTAPWFEDGKPATLPEDFYSSEFLVDKLIEYVDSGRDDARPFFAYLAFQAAHIPVQAPREYVERYNGVYDGGWNAMRAQRRERAIELGLVPPESGVRPVPAGLRDWDTLPEGDRKRLAKNMQVNAGMIEAMDHHFGRLVAHLKATGQYDNTVFLFLSDNGPEYNDPLDTPGMKQWLDRVGYSRELENLGEKGTYAYIGPEFASAAASPHDNFKFYTSEGGLRVPLIVAGPVIAQHAKVPALSFVSDLAPTLLDIAGVAPKIPEGMHPMTGRSLLPAIHAPGTPVWQDDEAVGIETAGNAALFMGHHKLVRNLPPFGDRQWRLFDLSTDPGETQDLAAAMPERFEQMRREYDAWAQRVGVLEVPPRYTAVRQLTINYLYTRTLRYGWIVLLSIVALWWLIRRRRRAAI